MYSVVSLSARVAGARPSRRSDERNRRSPSISEVVIGEAVVVCATAAAGRSATNSTNDCRRMWERPGGEIKRGAPAFAARGAKVSARAGDGHPSRDSPESGARRYDDWLRGENQAIRRGTDVAYRPARRERELRLLGGEERRLVAPYYAPVHDHPRRARRARYRDHRVAHHHTSERMEVAIAVRGDHGVAGLPGRRAPREMSRPRVELIVAHSLGYHLVELH